LPTRTNRPVVTRQARPLAVFACVSVALGAVHLRGAEPAPAVVIRLGPRHAQAEPTRTGFTHTGAGNIIVTQPTADTLVITMTGAAVAGPHPCQDSSASIPFVLDQVVEFAIVDPKVKQCKLVMEARVLGLLRSHSAYKCARATGSAEMSEAQAVISAENGEIAAVRFEPHAVAGEDLAINDRTEPRELAILPGKYTLRQTFAIHAAHPQRLLAASSASAEFAPETALDPLWLGLRDPFHGAVKKNYGFQVTVKLVPEQ
jgi:hypothetical protein